MCYPVLSRSAKKLNSVENASYMYLLITVLMSGVPDLQYIRKYFRCKLIQNYPCFHNDISNTSNCIFISFCLDCFAAAVVTATAAAVTATAAAEAYYSDIHEAIFICFVLNLSWGHPGSLTPIC